MNYSVNLNITPGGMPPILHMSQYDTGRTYLVTIKDADGGNASLGTNPTAKVKGFNGKNCFEIDATVANSVVTFTLTEASTDQCGVFPVTIELTVDGQDIISPLCMIFDVQKAGYTNEQAANSPEFQTAMEAAVAEAMSNYALLVVTFTVSGSSWLSDKTYAEIQAAVSANRPIWGVFGDYRLTFVGLDNGAIFHYIDTSTTSTILYEFFLATTNIVSRSSRNL